MIAAGFPLLLAALLGFDAAPTGGTRPASVPLERKPYAIRVFVAFDPSARFDALRQRRLLGDWTALARRLVGPPWELTLTPDEGPLAGHSDLSTLDLGALTAATGKSDQAWFIRVTAGASGGLELAGRTFDSRTARLSPTFRRTVRAMLDAPRGLMDLSLDLFTPYALIGEATAGGVRMTIQAAALTPAGPVGEVAPPGTLFRPVRIFQKADGSVLQVQDIRWTYVRVESNDAGAAECKIVSSYGDPLSRRAGRRNVLVALGVKSAGEPTRLRFVTADKKDPVAGHLLTAQPWPEGSPRPVALTDRDGLALLPPPPDIRKDAPLVKLRLLAGDIEPLAEFPVLLGETVDERAILVDLKPQAVELEAKVAALSDEVLDQIAKRTRLEAMLKTRAEDEKWDDVAALIEQYRKLPLRADFMTRLEAMRKDAADRQAETKIAILTRAAQARLADVESLLTRYLDDEAIKPYADDLAAAKSGKPKPKGQAQVKAKSAGAPTAKGAPAPVEPAEPETPAPKKPVAPRPPAEKKKPAAPEGVTPF